MDIDDAEPPSLVDVAPVSANAPGAIESQMQDLNLTKVPLTIVTEFGDSADIEKALTVSQDGSSTQEWLELGNGCICCSIKDSGVSAIESLMDRRGTFDYIMLETSGLADPGNLIPLFWVDDGLGSSIYLDGVVTLVDAKNILLSLDEKPPEVETAEHEGAHLTTAHLQVSHADVIVINKCDSVTPKQLGAVEERIRAINGLAKIHRTSYSQIPQLESFLLDLHAYDGIDNLDATHQLHSHLDPSISTISFPIQPLTPSYLSALDAWLRSLCWDSTFPHPNPVPSTPQTLNPNHNAPPQTTTDFSIHRLKGRLVMRDGSVKMVQGVREVFEIVDLSEQRSGGGGGRGGNEGGGYGETSSDEHGTGKIVIIGRGLVDLPWEESLKAFLERENGTEA